MPTPKQWMTFQNLNNDWQNGNIFTVFGDNDIITLCQPRGHWMKDMSFFKAFKTALEDNIAMVSYSKWEFDRVYKITKTNIIPKG